jgi:hypothetical protein
MASRRTFLQIALGGATLAPLAVRDALDRSAGASPRLYKAIFDRRFPASIAFALDAERRGVPVHGIAGDVTALWYHDLYFAWRRGPAPIAGVTTEASLFCLEMLARDAGLRVTGRRSLADNLVSWSIGPGA